MTRYYVITCGKFFLKGYSHTGKSSDYINEIALSVNPKDAYLFEGTKGVKDASEIARMLHALVKEVQLA